MLNVIGSRIGKISPNIIKLQAYLIKTGSDTEVNGSRNKISLKKYMYYFLQHFEIVIHYYTTVHRSSSGQGLVYLLNVYDQTKN